MAVAAFAGAALLIAPWGGAVPILSPVLGLLLVLWLPGHAIVAALFPSWRLWAAERIVLHIAVSLGVTVVGGYLLNLTPWGLHATTWGVLLGTATLAAVGVALVRREEPATETPRAVLERLRRHKTSLILLALTGAGMAAAVILARNGALAQPTNGFTQLWILSTGPAGAENLNIGIRSAETQTLSYDLALLTSDSVVRDWPEIRLQPGEEWSVKIPVPAGVAAGQPVAAVLYRQDDPETVYRRVLWWPPAPDAPETASPPPLPPEWPTVPPPPGVPSPTPGPVTPSPQSYASPPSDGPRIVCVSYLPAPPTRPALALQRGNNT
jgi:hypothetical protein